MADFDWYISPAERFSYESQFAKHSGDGDDITLPQLDPVFHQSRLQTEEFLQIWQLVDIRFEQRLNKTQFVYFMHILTQRRRGRTLPVGLPLNVKEEFLKESRATSSVYVRPAVNVRDVGASSGKSASELEAELALLDLDLGAADREHQLAQSRLAELRKSCDEVEGIAKYTLDHAQALDREIAALRESLRSAGGSLGATAADPARTRELIARIAADRGLLEQMHADLQRQLAAATSSLA
ncbi:hypothetical protein HK105_205764 [Polyrhizophydium stewartii]|uniref:EH domain-containing protein n=1 Tax=Polyrhizophydium stewartii TaxID=2732419 RepID=A0ABR4N566_9FUNG|nr:endocytosis defective- protein [Polyrhizophydium stewartii]